MKIQNYQTWMTDNAVCSYCLLRASLLWMMSADWEYLQTLHCFIQHIIKKTLLFSSTINVLFFNDKNIQNCVIDFNISKKFMSVRAVLLSLMSNHGISFKHFPGMLEACRVKYNINPSEIYNPFAFHGMTTASHKM